MKNHSKCVSRKKTIEAFRSTSLSPEIQLVKVEYQVQDNW